MAGCREPGSRSGSENGENTDHPRKLANQEWLFAVFWGIILTNTRLVKRLDNEWIPSSTVLTVGCEPRGRRGFSRDGAEVVFHLCGA